MDDKVHHSDEEVEIADDSETISKMSTVNIDNNRFSVDGVIAEMICEVDENEQAGGFSSPSKLILGDHHSHSEKSLTETMESSTSASKNSFAERLGLSSVSPDSYSMKFVGDNDESPGGRSSAASVPSSGSDSCELQDVETSPEALKEKEPTTRRVRRKRKHANVAKDLEKTSEQNPDFVTVKEERFSPIEKDEGSSEEHEIHEIEPRVTFSLRQVPARRRLKCEREEMEKIKSADCQVAKRLKLGNISGICDRMRTIQKQGLKPLFRIIYCQWPSGNVNKVICQILQFGGFPFSKDSHEFSKRRNLANGFVHGTLSNICDILGLPLGTKIEMVDRILNFLQKPSKEALLPAPRLPDSDFATKKPVVLLTRIDVDKEKKLLKRQHDGEKRLGKQQPEQDHEKSLVKHKQQSKEKRLQNHDREKRLPKQQQNEETEKHLQQQQQEPVKRGPGRPPKKRRGLLSVVSTDEKTHKEISPKRKSSDQKEKEPTEHTTPSVEQLDQTSAVKAKLACTRLPVVRLTRLTEEEIAKMTKKEDIVQPLSPPEQQAVDVAEHKDEAKSAPRKRGRPSKAELLARRMSQDREKKIQPEREASPVPLSNDVSQESEVTDNASETEENLKTSGMNEEDLSQTRDETEAEISASEKQDTSSVEEDIPVSEPASEQPAAADHKEEHIPRGIKLTNFTQIRRSVNNAEKSVLQRLHVILYGTSDHPENMKANILNFSGFEFAPQSDDWHAKSFILSLAPTSTIREFIDMLHLHVPDSVLPGPSPLVDILMDFLMAPRSELLDKSSFSAGKKEKPKKDPLHQKLSNKVKKGSATAPKQSKKGKAKKNVPENKRRRKVLMDEATARKLEIEIKREQRAQRRAVNKLANDSATHKVEAVAPPTKKFVPSLKPIAFLSSQPSPTQTRQNSLATMVTSVPSLQQLPSLRKRPRSAAVFIGNGSAQNVEAVKSGLDMTQIAAGRKSSHSHTGSTVQNRVKLGESMHVQFMVVALDYTDLEVIHNLLFLHDAVKARMRRNILEFSGFNFDETSYKYDVRKILLRRFGLVIVKRIAFILGLTPIKNDHPLETLVDMIMQFLLSPTKKEEIPLKDFPPNFFQDFPKDFDKEKVYKDIPRLGEAISEEWCLSSNETGPFYFRDEKRADTEVKNRSTRSDLGVAIAEVVTTDMVKFNGVRGSGSAGSGTSGSLQKAVAFPVLPTSKVSSSAPVVDVSPPAAPPATSISHTLPCENTVPRCVTQSSVSVTTQTVSVPAVTPFHVDNSEVKTPDTDNTEVRNAGVNNSQPRNLVTNNAKVRSTGTNNSQLGNLVTDNIQVRNLGAGNSQLRNAGNKEITNSSTGNRLVGNPVMHSVPMKLQSIPQVTVASVSTSVTRHVLQTPTVAQNPVLTQYFVAPAQFQPVPGKKYIVLNQNQISSVPAAIVRAQMPSSQKFSVPQLHSVPQRLAAVRTSSSSSQKIPILPNNPLLKKVKANAKALVRNSRVAQAFSVPAVQGLAKAVPAQMAVPGVLKQVIRVDSSSITVSSQDAASHEVTMLKAPEGHSVPQAESITISQSQKVIMPQPVFAGKSVTAGSPPPLKLIPELTEVTSSVRGSVLHTGSASSMVSQGVKVIPFQTFLHAGGCHVSPITLPKLSPAPTRVTNSLPENVLHSTPLSATTKLNTSSVSVQQQVTPEEVVLDDDAEDEEEEDEESAEFPSDEDLFAKIRDIIHEADSETLTLKFITDKLCVEYPDMDVVERRAFIKTAAKNIINGMTSATSS